jgi:hypothetical protein
LLGNEKILPCIILRENSLEANIPIQTTNKTVIMPNRPIGVVKRSLKPTLEAKNGKMQLKSDREEIKPRLNPT